MANVNRRITRGSLTLSVCQCQCADDNNICVKNAEIIHKNSLSCLTNKILINWFSEGSKILVYSGSSEM